MGYVCMGGCCSWSLSLGYREKAKLHKLSAYRASTYCHIVLWFSYKPDRAARLGFGKLTHQD